MEPPDDARPPGNDTLSLGEAHGGLMTTGSFMRKTERHDQRRSRIVRRRVLTA
jgi:hypothetical protein